MHTHAPSQKYTYELCPFKSAKQDHTSLGRWDAEDGKGEAAVKGGVVGDDPWRGRFVGGTQCWNGPKR